MSKNTGAAVTVAKSSNISLAWGSALLRLLEQGPSEISPLIFCITGFDPETGPEEDQDIRQALDQHLVADKKLTVDKVAFTIFPREIWELADGDPEVFFEDCQSSAPRFRKAHRNNSCGLYFERLMNFGADYENKKDGLNQLKKIIDNYAEGNHRRSMLQATTYDPLLDLNNRPYQGFPCLQHVTFAPDDGCLSINAFYTYQYLVTKAYGNLVGLVGLGKFMASIMGTKLNKLTLNAGVEHLDPAKGNTSIVEIANLLRTRDLSDVLLEL